MKRWCVPDRDRAIYPSLGACVLLLLLLPAVATAQGFTVAGQVVDGVSGSAVGRAAVSLEPAGTGAAEPAADWASAARQLLTGVDGSFRFAGVPAGRYRVRAARRGYVAASFDQHGEYFAAVIAGAGRPEAERLRFVLMPLGSIRGTVLDSTGDPVLAATVTLLGTSRDGSGAIVPVRSASVQRGSDRYTFSNLEPGTYYLAVTGRPWWAESGEEGDSAGNNPLDVAYAPMFFDGAESSSGAQPVVLRAGESAEANFSMHAVPALHVLLRAGGGGSGGDAGGLPALTVPAFDGALGLPMGMFLGQGRQRGGDGSLQVTVAPGTYALSSGGGVGAVTISADSTLDSAATAAGAALQGKVAMADGSALPSGLRLRLLGVSGDRGGVMDGPEAGSDGVGGRLQQTGSNIRYIGRFGRRPLEVAIAGDGSFAADSVPAGRYRLELARPGAGVIAITGAAASGATVGEDMTLRVQGEPVILAVTASAASAQVDGRAADGRGAPVGGALVLLVPANGAATLERVAESNSDGGWAVRDVAPGEYRLVAIRDGWDIAWRRPEALARYLAGATLVVVRGDGLSGVSVVVQGR
ncbi:carboxypeptidase-like regulatory domain-containing protein [Acidipila sp. EB88]|uniref:carboxypeptidase-like regulatory domain-containing protein n=1 Tax=Acidipila sp. EB88 TaxID=2305226 RepID=UPI0013155B4E|nr:carboxypeptidase-like regulatory domain-containing protein [Acidipila sp. EB88]